MKFLEIRLAANESNWRLFMTRKSDPTFLAFAKKVHERDQYTCRYCGFQAEEYQEVVNIDGNYRRNRMDNLVTACCFCAQDFFLEAVGKSDFGGGNLIYLPEMSQSELNALCHILFTAIASGNQADETAAKNIYRTMRIRSQIVEQEIGDGFSVPSLYGQLLIDAQVNPEHKRTVAQQLSTKLRLLPDIERFTTQLETWIVSALKHCGFPR